MTLKVVHGTYRGPVMLKIHPFRVSRRDGYTDGPETPNSEHVDKNVTFLFNNPLTWAISSVG